MFDVGGGELLLIILAVLVLFGPEKLPELAQMFGKGMQQVKRAQAQFQSQLIDIQSEVQKTMQPITDDINSIKNIKSIESLDYSDYYGPQLNVEEDKAIENKEIVDKNKNIPNQDIKLNKEGLPE